MIQLEYTSSGFASVAFFTETETSASTGVIQLINDISGEESNVSGSIVSNKVYPDFGGWILLSITSSGIPTESGQYTANIYETGELQVTWGTAFKTWGAVASEWQYYATESNAKINLLDEDRAIVSGSDYDSLGVYSYQDNSDYTVYNG